MAASSVHEASSFANYAQCRVRHHDMSLAVDFDAKTIAGEIKYTAEVLEPCSHLILDTNQLVVQSVAVNGAPAKFLLQEHVEPFGRALHVPLATAPLAVGQTVTVAVKYSTTATSAALQWLTTEMTADKKGPFLFTQCQAIHARSLLPCQDSPGVKSTYSAAVSVGGGMVALMSAVGKGSSHASEGLTTYSFEQAVPMPSYLIALAVGHLESRRVGPRSLVYAEPSIVESAAYEFAETESFVAAGETLLGPYVWGDYNVLVLPPSFPYGGMENPCLTFVTPTLLAGDRSLVDVIAHEATHSWMGNLVTNAAAQHFWLNEGWTMMIQRKILGLLHGDAVFDFDAFSGFLALRESTSKFLERGNAEYTKLVPDLTGVDPDDSFSSIPYEKGFYLLYYLQTVVGRPAFECFMHDYVQVFKYKSISSGDFQKYFTAYFAEGRHSLPRVSHSGPPIHNGAVGAHDPADIRALSTANTGTAAIPSAGVSAEAAAAAVAQAIDVSSVNWDSWWFGTGMPTVVNTYDATQRGVVDGHADAWVADHAKAAAAAPGVTAEWRSTQWIAFLERLVAISSDLGGKAPRAVIAQPTLHALDTFAKFSSSRNAEIRVQWGLLGVRSGLQEVVPGVVAFLKEQGRMKYVRPLFCELLRSAHTRALALELFAAHSKAYHPICAKMVAIDIEKETAKAAVDPAACVQA